MHKIKHYYGPPVDSAKSSNNTSTQMLWPGELSGSAASSNIMGTIYRDRAERERLRKTMEAIASTPAPKVSKFFPTPAQITAREKWDAAQIVRESAREYLKTSAQGPGTHIPEHGSGEASEASGQRDLPTDVLELAEMADGSEDNLLPFLPTNVECDLLNATIESLEYRFNMTAERWSQAWILPDSSRFVAPSMPSEGLCRWHASAVRDGTLGAPPSVPIPCDITSKSAGPKLILKPPPTLIDNTKQHSQCMPHNPFQELTLNSSYPFIGSDDNACISIIQLFGEIGANLTTRGPYNAVCFTVNCAQLHHNEARLHLSHLVQRIAQVYYERRSDHLGWQFDMLYADICVAESACRRACEMLQFCGVGFDARVLPGMGGSGQLILFV